MKLAFHGAAHQATGSCHLVECCGRKIPVDCGMFQGLREKHEDNAAPFGFDAKEIEAVLLTRPHLVHCGRILPLVKLVMPGPAYLHEEEARRHHRHGRRGGRRTTASAYAASW